MNKQSVIKVPCISVIAICVLTQLVVAQSVCLPAPRLLTTMPMGGKVGTEFEVTISGDYIEEAGDLYFSTPGITANRKMDESGQPVANQYVVSIADDCPVGVYEARVYTRLGLSTARAFNVNRLDEVTRTSANTTLATAMELKANSICNAYTSAKSVDHYWIDAQKGQRLIVECAAGGIDSKLNAVLIVADENGGDLVVERRGGMVDFKVPADGRYVIKVHDLTFKGGPYLFYRLALNSVEGGALPAQQPSTHSVGSVSWPPVGLAETATAKEAEPNNEHAQAQKISLPCDIDGQFFPAADVDLFEFEAKAGEVWWVEVASQRFGLPTDPTVIVQQVGAPEAGGEAGRETLTDIAELSDIPSPVKVSSNHYTYDGPPYNVGSTDVLGKFEVKQDGTYRLQVSDLFGGTRTDPNCRYRLIVREAEPDFALVAWGLHMELRNGDRNALSKPIALRGGATMPLEVIAVRRDGFDGPIELAMDNLPDGVTATGLTIPSGQSRGIVLVTAHESAPDAVTKAKFVGRADIDGKQIERPCRMASMKWPVKDARSEIPNPRLLQDVIVSVTNAERAPISISPGTVDSASSNVFEVAEGGKLTIPLSLTRRIDLSGSTMRVLTFGSGFDKNPRFEIDLNSEQAEAVLDLAKLKTAPGEYKIAFYGGVVAKYSYNPGEVLIAEEAVKKLTAQQEAAMAEVARLVAETKKMPAEKKAEAQKLSSAAAKKNQALIASVAAAKKRVVQAKQKSKAKDIADIVVSEPISVRVIGPDKVAGKPPTVAAKKKAGK